jgi:hypothetical protein
MVQRLADQQTTAALRAHLMSTARGWRRMADARQKAEDAVTGAEDAELGSPVASISSRAA